MGRSSIFLLSYLRLDLLLQVAVPWQGLPVAPTALPASSSCASSSLARAASNLQLVFMGEAVCVVCLWMVLPIPRMKEGRGQEKMCCSTGARPQRQKGARRAGLKWSESKEWSREMAPIAVRSGPMCIGPMCALCVVALGGRGPRWRWTGLPRHQSAAQTSAQLFNCFWCGVFGCVTSV